MADSKENKKTIDTLNRISVGLSKLSSMSGQVLLDKNMQFNNTDLNKGDNRKVPLSASPELAYAKAEHYYNTMGVKKEDRGIPEAELKKIYENNMVIDAALSDLIKKLLGF